MGVPLVVQVGMFQPCGLPNFAEILGNLGRVEGLTVCLYENETSSIPRGAVSQSLFKPTDLQPLQQ